MGNTNGCNISILEHIKDGPLKLKLQHYRRGLIFRTPEEKSAKYIIEILRRSGTDEGQRPMSDDDGYWGGVIELLRLAANKERMVDAISILLIDQTDEIKNSELKNLCEAQSKIKHLWATSNHC